MQVVVYDENFGPNIEFDFNVSVSNCILSTDTSKSSSMLGTFSGICPGGFHLALIVFDDSFPHILILRIY